MIMIQTMTPFWEMTTLYVLDKWKMKNLCIDIFKTLSYLNPQYMQELFELLHKSCLSYSTRRPNDLKIYEVNQTWTWLQKRMVEEAKLWNHLPENIKSSKNLSIFQNLNKHWNDQVFLWIPLLAPS